MSNLGTKNNDKLIHNLIQSKKEALVEISKEYNTPEFQDALLKLRKLNKSQGAL